MAGFAKVSRVCRDSLRRKIFRVVDLFIVLYSLFFIRYLFSRFASEENLPAVDPIIIFYFLIVIGYFSGFTTEENLQGCWFVYCSLFFVLYSIFIFKVCFGGKSPGRRSDYYFIFFDCYWIFLRVHNGGKSSGLLICLLFIILCSLFDIYFQGLLRRKIFLAVDPIIIFYFLIVIGYSSGFTTEEYLPGCWFVYCSLFDIIFQGLIRKKISRVVDTINVFGPLPHRGVSL